MKLRVARKTLGNVLKVGLRILTTMEMSYAKSQNAMKYHQYIDKIIGEITTWQVSNPLIKVRYLTMKINQINQTKIKQVSQF